MSLPAKLAGKGNIAKQLSAKPLPGALYMNSGTHNSHKQVLPTDNAIRRARCASCRLATKKPASAC
ncbi:hypothetical protein TKWG_12215 [Advenella kashmirensis WT001]|uniref:Uncharacterized protein n=1 Tax=Advenella kashmirensis (strain DSM 17095 / LMG 22695 / WT001) TaxID=1036672 RepID=I3UC72_ADVKW|nr:hypothetical protein TKWG_12215 [Advenella kashmirensis WT001]